MRLLILTFSYAPRPNARAIRWTALAEEFARRGHDVSVITSWQPGEPENELRSGVDVHRVGSPLAERLRHRLAAGRSTSAVSDGAIGDRPKGPLTGAMRMLNRGVWRNLWWPDSTCVWARPAIDQARSLIASEPFDAVVSVSPAFTAVLAGYRIRQAAVARPRWVIDLGDPFSFMEQAPPNNFRLYRRINRWFERRAFAKSDAISVTNKPTRDIYARLYPESAAKVAVIPPLLSLCEIPRESEAPFFNSEAKLRLVFLGTLYREIRRPDFLLALFSRARLQGAELHFVGDTHECADTISACAAVTPGIVTHGPVSRQAALKAICEADVLVNLGNETAFQLPSKLIEYAATGKRILNISQGEGDSSSEFLAAYPLALCLDTKAEAPRDEQLAQFASFCTSAEVRKIERKALEPFLEKHRLHTVADQYERLIAAGAGGSRQPANCGATTES